MPVPDYQPLMLPVLSVASRGEVRMSEAVDRIAARRGLRRNRLHGRIGGRRGEAAVTVFGADGRGAPAQGAPAARNAPPSRERPAAPPPCPLHHASNAA